MAAKKKNFCSWCKKPFESTGKRKYCSPACKKQKLKADHETLNQFIINKFLKNPKSIWADKFARSRELAFTKRLIKIYEMEVFWKAIPIAFPSDTLAWYLSPKGLEYLKEEHAKFCLDLKPLKKYDMSDTRYGENKTLTKKAKTLKDFLNNGGKKEDN